MGCPSSEYISLVQPQQQDDFGEASENEAYCYGGGGWNMEIECADRWVR